MGAETDAALINMSGQLANNAINFASVQSQTSKARRYNLEMYAKQRADALADWNRQNEYNSPLQQMARLKAAGLNPNLVYGHGAEAMSTAPPRGVDAKAWNPQAPQVNFDAGSVMSQYYDAKIKEQTVNNMKAAQQNTEMETLLKAAQRTNVLTNTDLAAFNLKKGEGLYPGSLQIQQATVDKIIQDMDIERQKNARAATFQGEQILNMIQQRSINNLTMEQKQQAIELMKKDQRIKELDAQFADKGVRPNDGMIWKIIADILGRVTGKSMWDILK